MIHCECAPAAQGHTGCARAEGVGLVDDAWVRADALAGGSVGLDHRVRGSCGLPVAVSAGSKGIDRRGVGHVGTRASCTLLQPDGGWSCALPQGIRALARIRESGGEHSRLTESGLTCCAAAFVVCFGCGRLITKTFAAPSARNCSITSL